MIPWLETDVTPAGSGLSIVTSKLTVTLLPPAMLPTSTPTVVSPIPLPLLTVPAVVCTLPTTSAVLAPGLSVKVTPVAAALPLFVIVT